MINNKHIDQACSDLHFVCAGIREIIWVPKLGARV